MIGAVGFTIAITGISYGIYICWHHYNRKKCNINKYPNEQPYQERILYVHTPPTIPIQPIYIQSDASYSPMAATPMPKYNNF